MDIAFIKTAFLTLFVAVDSPGMAPIFLTLTAHMTKQERKDTAYRSVVIAFGILAAAALGGEQLLSSLGIGLPAFRIAGGLLLFSIAAEMVFERREQRKSDAAENAIAHDHPKNIAAFPLAMPLMAGPGAITATILQASLAHGSWVNLCSLLVIVFLVVLTCLPIFLLAERVERFMGVSGKVILQRLLGVLLAAMAVQAVGDGIMTFIRS